MFEYITGLLWGVIIGFSVAVPIGPVGLICIQRTISRNKMSGLISGFGSATADVLLASIGAFSITIIFSFIQKEQTILKIIGGLLLLVFAIVTYFSKPKHTDKPEVDTTLDLIEEYISGFALTITNPFTAFTFFVAFAGISTKIGGGISMAICFLVGIFIGACLWWLFLTTLAEKIAHKIHRNHLKSINKWFALIIGIIGLFIIGSVLLR